MRLLCYCKPLVAATIIFSIALVFCRCSSNGPDNTIAEKKDNKTGGAIGTIELYDSSALQSIDRDANIVVIGKNYTWAEGPVWIAGKQQLLFSDVPENKIYQWKEGDTPHVYVMPAGYTGKAPRMGEIGSNGLALDTKCRLLICQSGNRQIARLDIIIQGVSPQFTVLCNQYKGKKFNSPNDLAADKNNNIYFTDPVYGLPQQEKDKARELPFEGVYKLSAGGKLQLLIDTIRRPNGVALSADEKTLYIASSDSLQPAWFAYQLDDNGNIKSGGVLLDAKALKQKASVKQGPDGMKIDKRGNIFSAGPDGISILSPAGKRLSLIKIYNRKTSNCAFNETKNVLYVTADDVVLKIVLHQ